MSENELYKQMYYKLFNAVTDAIEAIDKGELSPARDILVSAQQQTEELFISQV
ncbi:MAG: hypothetical protein IJ364_04730 [Oscillospiraceae bacterium]|nr:hypothetical protein [Oscillospiraceae bacterium]